MHLKLHIKINQIKSNKTLHYIVNNGVEVTWTSDIKIENGYAEGKTLYWHLKNIPKSKFPIINNLAHVSWIRRSPHVWLVISIPNYYCLCHSGPLCIFVSFKEKKQMDVLKIAEQWCHQKCLLKRPFSFI